MGSLVRVQPDQPSFKININMLGLRTLVLNASYMPISLLPLHTVPVEDAVGRIFNDSCHVVFSYNRWIQTPNLHMKWPSVIARNSYVNVKSIMKLKRESLFRLGFVCLIKARVMNRSDEPLIASISY